MGELLKELRKIVRKELKSELEKEIGETVRRYDWLMSVAEERGIKLDLVPRSDDVVSVCDLIEVFNEQIAGSKILKNKCESGSRERYYAGQMVQVRIIAEKLGISSLLSA